MTTISQHRDSDELYLSHENALRTEVVCWDSNAGVTVVSVLVCDACQTHNTEDLAEVWVPLDKAKELLAELTAAIERVERRES